MVGVVKDSIMQYYEDRQQFFMPETGYTPIGNINVPEVKSMPKFVDTHGMGSFTPEQLKALQKAPRDEFGVVHDDILFNKQEDKVFCILDAPNKEAVLKHHQKVGVEPEWILEVQPSK